MSFKQRGLRQREALAMKTKMDLFDLLLILLGFRRWGSEYPNIQARTACWTGGAYFVAAVIFLFVHGARTGAETEWLIAWGLAIALAACSSPAILWLLCGRRWTAWPPARVLLLSFGGALAATFAWRLLFDLFVLRALHGAGADARLFGGPLAWTWSLSIRAVVQFH